MSRIGKLPVAVPAGVNIDVTGPLVKVKGPKGELQQPILEFVTVKLEGSELVVERKNDGKSGRSAHGLTRTLIQNMVVGVTTGFRKSLELQGVGYRAAKAGNNLNLSLGYSHPVTYEAPSGITACAARSSGPAPGRGCRSSAACTTRTLSSSTIRKATRWPRFQPATKRWPKVSSRGRTLKQRPRSGPRSRKRPKRRA